MRLAIREQPKATDAVIGMKGFRKATREHAVEIARRIDWALEVARRDVGERHGSVGPSADRYRVDILKKLSQMGYEAEWRVVYCTDFAVPQDRKRASLVAFTDRVGRPDAHTAVRRNTQ